MDYRSFKNIDEKVSLLGVGCMRLPKLAGGGDKDIDMAHAEKMFDMAIAQGATYFDTAYVYHGQASEAATGKLLKKYNRADYYLATKLPIWLMNSEADTERMLNEQLERLGTDYIDFYLLHSLDKGSFAKAEKYHVYETLLEMKKAGKIRHLGFSFHDKPEVLETIASAHQWDFAQIQLNYYDWENYRSREQYEVLVKHDIPVIVMEPVHGGTLADLGERANALLQKAAPGKSVASWAMRYAASLPGVMCVLSGMSNEAQMADNLATFNPFTPLDDAERDTLSKALSIFEEGFIIPCTACRYCMPCPVNIDIPGTLAAYSKHARNAGMKEFKRQYEAMDGEPASACISCGQCASVCPQHLEIPKLMEQIDALTLPRDFQL